MKNAQQIFIENLVEDMRVAEQIYDLIKDQEKNKDTIIVSICSALNTGRLLESERIKKGMNNLMIDYINLTEVFDTDSFKDQVSETVKKAKNN